MQRIYRRLTKLLTYWYYWILDYIYVSFWQIVGLFKKTRVGAFLKTPTHPLPTHIILIPGVYERWDFMKPIARIILQSHYPVHVVEGLGFNNKTIEEAAFAVEDYIKDKDLKNCLIVAHSKGGLIGKYLMGFSAVADRIHGMVALNTPFSGSVYARAFILPAVRVFIPNSPILQKLATSKDINSRIYSLYSTFDPHVPGGSYLEGAINMQLPTYGHFRVINDPSVHEVLLKALSELSSHRIK